jgi:hypothetical protein
LISPIIRYEIISQNDSLVGIQIHYLGFAFITELRIEKFTKLSNECLLSQHILDIARSYVWQLNFNTLTHEYNIVFLTPSAPDTHINDATLKLDLLKVTSRFEYKSFQNFLTNQANGLTTGMIANFSPIELNDALIQIEYLFETVSRKADISAQMTAAFSPDSD